MRGHLIRSTLAVAATVVVMLGAGVAVAGSAAAASGSVITGAGYTLKIRSAPSLSASVVGELRNGDRVEIDCQTEGPAVTGDYGRTTLWDRIKGRGYVSDAWIYTGSNSRVAPTCGTPSPTPTPAPAPAPAKLSVTGARCATLVVFGARGSGQAVTSGSINGFGPEVSNAAKAAIARVKTAGTVRYEGVVYPAVPVDTKWRTGRYFDSVGAGARTTIADINALLRDCSSTKVALVGYSQGASVMRWVLRDLPSASKNKVVLVGLIADPERRGFNVSPSEIGLYENFDSGTLYGSGILGAGPVLPASRASAVVSMCTKADNVCNSPSNTGWAVGDRGKIDGLKQATHTGFYQTSSAAAVAGSTMYIALAKNGLR